MPGITIWEQPFTTVGSWCRERSTVVNLSNKCESCCTDLRVKHCPRFPTKLNTVRFPLCLHFCSLFIAIMKKVPVRLKKRNNDT